MIKGVEAVVMQQRALLTGQRVSERGVGERKPVLRGGIVLVPCGSAERVTELVVGEHLAGPRDMRKQPIKHLAVGLVPVHAELLKMTTPRSAT
jgi:hypothetical protein